MSMLVVQPNNLIVVNVFKILSILVKLHFDIWLYIELLYKLGRWQFQTNVSFQFPILPILLLGLFNDYGLGTTVVLIKTYIVKNVSNPFGGLNSPVLPKIYVLLQQNFQFSISNWGELIP
jgi:hypothetical protein